MSQSAMAVMRWTVFGVTWTASPLHLALDEVAFADLEQHPADQRKIVSSF